MDSAVIRDKIVVAPCLPHLLLGFLVEGMMEFPILMN
jgi:hypothetical protein